MGRSPIQGVLPKCEKGFIVLEVNSDSKLAREPNPWNIKFSSQNDWREGRRGKENREK
jgi:hypothetical protein